VDLHYRFQKRHRHAADREDSSRQASEWRTNTYPFANGNRYTDSYCDTEPNTLGDTNGHSKSNTLGDADCHAYTKSNGDPNACAWRHCFQWILVHDGEDSRYGDLPGFLSDRHRDT
jgi:hypothetical protein